MQQTKGQHKTRSLDPPHFFCTDSSNHVEAQPLLSSQKNLSLKKQDSSLCAYGGSLSEGPLWSPLLGSFLGNILVLCFLLAAGSPGLPALLKPCL